MSNSPNKQALRLLRNSLPSGRFHHRNIGRDQHDSERFQDRFLRLRTSTVPSIAPVVVWETSANRRNWFPHYFETAGIPLTALRIVPSAGTTKSAVDTGAAVFDHVTMERLP